jgi:uncharacterized protein with FMN-binding domain
MNRSRKALSKKAKIVLFSSIIIVVAIALAVGIRFLVSFNSYKSTVAAIQIKGVDLSTIGDGEYYGDCDTGLVSAKVRVVVKDRVITELELLEHHNGRGKAADVLPETMLKEQRVDVDTITGATSSSNVIREAVYNALTGERTTGK